MKIKLLITVIFLTIITFSCKDDDDDETTPFDHAAQALEDDQKIRTYLETHFYTPPTNNDTFGTVSLIENDETPIMDQVTTQDVTFADIDFKLYYLKNMPEGTNETASKIDSVFVKYQGLFMDDSLEDPKFDEKVNYTWLSLSSTIKGWSYGFPNYNSGTNTSIPDMPITYENTGKGMLFIPSGLAYSNIGNAAIEPNKILMFHIELAQVLHSDHDFDGIISNNEDVDNDNDPTNDNTDDDSLPNYLDIDDDDDHILTKYENVDPNEDGNPDDAQDTDGDNQPDYLDNDDDGDGILTIDENADPDRNGNPDDAEDIDGDNIPNYLDSDS